MKEIIKGVNALATEELIRIGGSVLYHSDHEALGVIAEEVSGVEIEKSKIDMAFEGFVREVFQDREGWEKIDDIKDLRKAAVLCACDAIRIVAMCDKYFMWKEAEKK